MAVYLASTVNATTAAMADQLLIVIPYVLYLNLASRREDSLLSRDGENLAVSRVLDFYPCINDLLVWNEYLGHASGEAGSWDNTRPSRIT